MANVSQPILPTRLYRYRGLTRSANAIDQEVDAISENYIYCSDFEGMNDPMEGFFRPSKLLKGSAEYRDIARDIVSSKSAIGIASLTETYDSSLMWAHYASNYSGICVEYSTQDLLDCLSDAVCLVRLAYVDNPLLVLPKLAPTPTTPPRAFYRRSISAGPTSVSGVCLLISERYRWVAGRRSARY